MTAIRHRCCLTAVIVVILISGCSTLSMPGASVPDNPAWQIRQSELQTVTDWTLAGRISVIQGDQGWHANLLWEQEDARYRLDLVGPFGQGRVNIEGRGDRVRMQTADGQILTADDPETLLAQALDIQLPLNGLRYWIRGLPAPGSDVRPTIDSEGRLAQLQQDGWQIDYSRYDQVADYQLPVRIRAERGQDRV